MDKFLIIGPAEPAGEQAPGKSHLHIVAGISLCRLDRRGRKLRGLIDLLAWDIKSRKAGLPLYQLIGGNNPKVPAYASTVTWDTMDEYEGHIKECMDEGFTAFKLHAWGDAKEDAKLSRNLGLPRTDVDAAEVLATGAVADAGAAAAGTTAVVG